LAPDDREQPARKLRLIDRIEVLMERQKRIARQLLGQLASANTPHGKAEHRVHVQTVKRLEVRHSAYERAVETEEKTRGFWRLIVYELA
jgi:hypothetical protein